MNKGFALQVAESLLISIDAGGRGWVADQTEVVQNGRSRWLPTLIFGRVLITIENGVSTVKHIDHLQAHPFGDLREAVKFAEAWAAPQRIQRKRTAGWKMPANTVYVGRPTYWGNQYRVGEPDPYTGEPMTAADAVMWFQSDYDAAVSPEAAERREEVKRELAGKDLACWCKVGEPCHADVLLQIANEE